MAVLEVQKARNRKLRYRVILSEIFDDSPRDGKRKTTRQIGCARVAQRTGDVKVAHDFLASRGKTFPGAWQNDVRGERSVQNNNQKRDPVDTPLRLRS